MSMPIVQMTAFLMFAAAIGAVLGWWWRGLRRAGGGVEAGPEHGALERARAAARHTRAELAAANERLQRSEQELAECVRQVDELRRCLSAAERAQPAVLSPRPAKLAIVVDDTADEIAAADAVTAAGASVPASAVELTMIRGVGAATAALLRRLGYPTVAHVAAWEQADLDRVVAAKSALKGRIERERWVEQARAILAGRGGGTPP